MPAYRVHLSLPFRSHDGRDLGTKQSTFALYDPPHPAAALEVVVAAHGRLFRIPVTIPTVDADGNPLPDGFCFDAECPEGIEVPQLMPPPNINVVNGGAAEKKPRKAVTHKLPNGDVEVSYVYDNE